MERPNERPRVLVLAETEGGDVSSLTFELLQAGRGVTQRQGTVLAVVLLGSRIEGTAERLALYAHEVYVADHPLMATPDRDLTLRILQALAAETSAGLIIMGHTLGNSEVAPRLAFRLGMPAITDVIAVDRGADGQAIVCEKPVYGDKARATYLLPGPGVVTLRPKSLPPASPQERKGQIITIPVEASVTKAQQELVETIPGEGVSLDKADAVVAGGRGVKDQAGIDTLRTLAASLGRFFGTVELGASRALVDSGLLPSSRQVGLTGEKVSPRLYVAVAISGASQHMSGISGSARIVALNKDEQAPIFEQADYGVVGDYEKIVPLLARALEELP